jgi:hypothetical protein
MAFPHDQDPFRTSPCSRNWLGSASAAPPGGYDADRRDRMQLCSSHGIVSAKTARARSRELETLHRCTKSGPASSGPCRTPTPREPILVLTPSVQYARRELRRFPPMHLAAMRVHKSAFITRSSWRCTSQQHDHLFRNQAVLPTVSLSPTYSWAHQRPDRLRKRANRRSHCRADS